MSPPSTARHPLVIMLLPLALLWLAGSGLRLTVLAVPPVIPLIHDELHLSETAVALLGSLPSLLFGFTAIPGALLIARFGAVPTLIFGLLLAAAGGAARGLAGDALTLDLATVAMGAGVAVMQPSMPPLVRAWVPQRVGFGTAVYTNGLIVGEIFPVALTIPLILPIFGGSWRWSFVLWSAPLVVTAILLMIAAPFEPAARGATPRRWWPDWKNPLVWRLAVIMGGVNTVYFATNTFIPDYLHATGDDAWISATLTSLNFWQLPFSLVMLLAAERLVRRASAYMVLGLLDLIAAIGLILLPGGWVVPCAGLLGGANAALLVLMLALPPTLAKSEDVPRVIAAMFTISYPTAVAMPVLAGLAWDATGSPLFAFAPAMLGSLLILGLVPTIDFRKGTA